MIKKYQNLFRQHVWQSVGVKNFEKHKATRVVIIQRGKNTHRYLSEKSRQKIYEKLIDLGYQVEIVRLERLSLGNQMKLMFDTDILIGAHGNAFGHLPWIRSNKLAVEILPSKCHGYHYPHIAGLYGINVFQWNCKHGFVHGSSNFVRCGLELRKGAGTPWHIGEMVVEDVDGLVGKVRKFWETIVNGSDPSQVVDVHECSSPWS